MAKKQKSNKVEAKPSLADILSGLKDVNPLVINEDSDKEFTIPYRIPFTHKGLQSITGGIMGGKFAEISGDSQTGKSFLLYELIKNTQDMGGYALLFDGERALEANYIKMTGIKKDGTLALEYNMDIDNFFGYSAQFILAIRAINKTCPILIGVDSFPSFTCPLALENMEKGQDPKGYAAMQKNNKFSQGIEKLIQILDEHAATLVVLNQTRIDHKIEYGDKTITLAENVVKFWCTQRIRGKLAKKIFRMGKSIEFKKGIKIITGSTTKWKTIKNRSVRPFQEVATKIKFNSGVDIYSGLDEYLVNADKIVQATTTKTVEGETVKKPIKGFRLVKTGEFFYDIKSLVDSNPDVLEPLWTGTDEEETQEFEGDETADGEVVSEE